MALTQQGLQNLKRELQNKYNSKLPDELLTILATAYVDSGNDIAEATTKMRQSEEYKKTFAGNLNPDGVTVKYSESEYLNIVDAYAWQSGYIYQEIDWSYNDGYGWGHGFTPGVINIANQGCQPDHKNVCSKDGEAVGGVVLFSADGSEGSLAGGAQINIEGALGYPPPGSTDGSDIVKRAMSTALPWRAAGAAISLSSTGGRGGKVPHPSGNGGKVNMSIMDYAFNVGPHTALVGSADAPFAVLSAVSRGGDFCVNGVITTPGKTLQCDVPNGATTGNGGDVAVDLDAIAVKSYGSEQTYQSEFVIGLVAASLGGANTAPVGASGSALAFQQGSGGDVLVALTDSEIHLPFNNSVGLIATSTGDDSFLPSGMQTVVAYPNARGGSVEVTLTGATIVVGSQSSSQPANAGDTNIGILANSSGNWGRELFTGNDLSHVMPGGAGDVSVSFSPPFGATAASQLEVYGPNAAGIVAQSIGGASISSSGATDVGGVTSDVQPAKDTSFPASNGGSVSIVVDANEQLTLLAQGNSAKGMVLQSIGGGGGAGGNSKGLFVAVGGAGGAGGQGGKLDVTLAGSRITADGEFARGVVGQSIGGGGGDGGHSTAYGLFVSSGIGGKGGAGGAGGAVDVSLSSSAIQTSGQHAYGVAFQSIGGGGGTGGAAQSNSIGAGVAVALAAGGSGGNGGAGGDLTVNLDQDSYVVTQGLDAHGILLQSISGGGGAAGAASATSYNVGQLPDVPVKVTFDMSIGGSGGSSHAAGKISVNNDGVIVTSGAGSYGLVLQSIGGGGGHGADSTAGSNSWGDWGKNPSLQLEASIGLGGSGGGGGAGGVIDLTSTGTISTAGHNSIGLLAHSIGGGGGTAGTGNAYSTSRWVGNNEGKNQLKTTSITTNLGAGGDGGAAGDGGLVNVTVNRSNGEGFTTLGSGSSGVVVQSIGGGGGVAGDAGTQAINGGDVAIAMQMGGQGGGGGNGGEVTVNFEGAIQTGAVTQLQYTDQNGVAQLSEPIAIGGSSHGIVAQSIGGGGGMGGNADPSAALVPTLTKDIVNWQYTLESFDPKKIDPKQIKSKILNIKDGIVFWAKRVVENEEDRPTFSISYSANMSLGGTGGTGGHGSAVNVNITDRSDITTYGHHSYALMAQSIGGGGGVAGTASANSLVSGDIKASKLGSDISVGMSVNVGGSGGASGNGGDVSILINNPLAADFDVPNNVNNGNYLRTGGHASHVVFGQSIGGGGGVGHEGSIIGITALPGVKNPGVNIGHRSSGAIAAGNGGNVTVAGPNSGYVTGWIESAGDASSLIFAQSVGGGGGTVSLGCTTNGRSGNQFIRHSPCFSDAAYLWDGPESIDYSAGAFVNEYAVSDITLNANGGNGGEVNVYLGDSHLTTDGDRAIAIVAQSIGGGGGYMSADAQNVGTITQNASTSVNSQGGGVLVDIAGGQGGSGNAYISTYGAGAWGVLAQSIGGGGGVFGDTSLDIVGVPSVDANLSRCGSDVCSSAKVMVSMTDAIIKTAGRNSHGIVAQSLAGGGGVFAGSKQSEAATLVLGSKLSGGSSASNATVANDYIVEITIDKDSSVSTSGEGAIGVLAQTNDLTASISLENSGSIIGGTTYTNTQASNRVVQGVGVMLSGGSGGPSNYVRNDGKISTVGGVNSGYAIMTDGGITNVYNYGTITGSVDLGSTPGTFTNEQGGVLNKGAVYKVGNNSLHNYGTINIGDESSLGTTNLQGRFVQHEGGRLIVTFDALNEQSTDQLIVDGTAIIGGSIQLSTKTVLPGSYKFLTATNLTVTAQALDRLLYDWDIYVDSNTVTAMPKQTLRVEGLSLSATSRNLVSYLERAWDNADSHHAELFGYQHELRAIDDYNSLLESLGGQALNAQPLQMRMTMLSALGDSMSCPTVTPGGLRLKDQSCVWAKLTGELAKLSGDSNNLGYDVSGGGLRVGVQKTLTDGWAVGVATGYSMNYLTANNFSSNGQFFDLSLSAKRDVGQWTFGAALGYAQGWFDNSRSVQAPAVGIASGFNRNYTSSSSMSIYGIKLRAAYTFEQEEHYIRPYLDFDVAYSQSPGFSETGVGNLALGAQSTNQWNLAVSPMVEYGADFVSEGQTRMKFYVSAGATFLPNNQQTSAMSFVGAQAGNGTFDVITDGPSILGRLNIGMQIYEHEGYEVRAQYGLQAGENYWSQSLSINALFRF